MTMQKTLFRKYLRVTALIVLISFLLLGMVMLIFVSRYWREEKRELLSQNAENLSVLTANNVMRTGNQYYVESSRIESFISVFSSSIGADIFVTNKAGEAVVCSDSGAADCIHKNRKVPDEIMNYALAGEFSGTGTLGGMYSNSQYIFGVPIRVDSGNGKIATVGAVFTSSDMSSLADFRTDVVRVFFFAMLITFLVTVLAVGIFTYRMVRPLREMSAAARCFGEGDFSRRVPVNSEDEIGRLAGAFNNMAASLSASEGMRRSFIANVSHELRTPMTTIAGFIDGILDGTIPEEKQSHYLKIVSDEVKRLSRMVRTMLDLSRIDSGELKMRAQRFDLTDTLLTTLLSFEKRIEEKNIQVFGLENAQSLFIDGDPDMLHQVFYNLVENAVKFVNEGGYIQVRVTDMSDRTVIALKNSGEGIAPDELALIFDRFYKADKSRSQDRNGMGLGLYIVRTIVKLHGGDITVRSAMGEFCEFEFWIPKTNEAPRLRES